MTDDAAAPSASSPGERPLGQLDRADHDVIAGWAYDPNRPGERVALTVHIDGQPVGTVLADRYRADLEASGLGDGRHSFEIRLPQGLSRAAARVVGVARAAGGAELERSPLVVPAEALTPDQALLVVAEAVQAAVASGDRAALQALLGRLTARLAELESAPAPPQAAFLRRWGMPGQDAPADPGASPTRRALFIDEMVPDPGRDAGSGAVLSHMQALQALGFGVDFVPAWSLDAEPGAVERLAALDIRVWHAPWIGSVEEALRAVGERLDLVYAHRYSVMEKYAGLVRRWCPQARLVYSVADLHHLRGARAEAVQTGVSQAGADGDAPMSPAMAALRAAEFNAVLAADATITHSGHEAGLLQAALPGAKVHLVPWVVRPQPCATPFAARAGVTFVGSYGHAPNLDAAWWLLDQVMPLVWAEDPGLTLLLAGSDLPDSLRAHATGRAGPVEVLGRLPDLATLWERARVSIAPLRFGAGLKGKVLDSLAAGVPCVCTPVAAEGMDFPALLQAQVADTPQELARRVLRLHADAGLNAELRAAGLAFIAARFNANVVRAGIAAAAAVQETP